MGNAVLVVIDMQRGFVNAATAPVVPTVVDLVARWRKAGGDVVLTRFVNRPGSPYVRLLRWSRFMGPPETDLVDGLRPYAGDVPVIDKTSYSLFAAPAGAELFSARGWRDVYLCGIATNACVLATAVGAFERGLTPHLVEDACASHHGPEAHAAGLLLLRHFIGADQMTTTAALDPGREAGDGP
ncbi:cysteine hydrolase [Actinomadura kijaniata]|uniref:cysteine hydrolase n=1 Tax=Actinomadura kijaniata TaxID=46161 RepID=UPI00082CAD5A|nr:cysteine hydrolase [Actinomadura kijaniata]